MSLGELEKLRRRVLELEAQLEASQLRGGKDKASDGNGTGGAEPVDLDAVDPHEVPRRFVRATLDALPDPVAVLDGAGIVLGVNRAWELAAGTGDAPLTGCGPGTSYLAVCAGLGGETAAAGRIVASGVRRLLAGSERNFSTEYRCVRAGRERWFAVRLRRFSDGGPPRLVVVHEETTDLKHAEGALLLRMEGEALVSEVARRLLSHSGEDIDELIVESLGKVAVWLGADAACLLLLSDDEVRLVRSHAWRDQDPGLPIPFPEEIRLAGGESSGGPVAGRTGSDSTKEQAAVGTGDDGSSGDDGAVMLPVHLAGKVAGLIHLLWHSRDMTATDAQLGPLRVFGDVLLSALARGRSERNLRQGNLHTRAILDAAVDGILTIDEHGRIESVNPSAERMFGYSQAELLGNNVSMLMPSPDRESHDSYLARYRRTGERKIIGIGREVVGLRRDGSEFPLELAVNEVQVGGRRVFMGTVRDISERKRLDAELESRARRQEFIANLGLRALEGLDPATLFAEAVTTVSATLRVGHVEILELTRRGDELRLSAGIGWKAEDLGAAVVEVSPSNYAGFTLAAREPAVVEEIDAESRFVFAPRLLEQGIRSGVSLLIHGSDGPHGVLGAYCRKRRSFSSDEVRFLQSVANVLALATRRHQAEAALLESDRRFRAIFDQSYQAIGLLKPDGTVLEANQAMLDLSGLERESLVGRPFWEGRWWSVSEDSRDWLREAVAQAAEGRFVRQEVQVLAAEDRIATLDFSIKPVADERGRVVLLIPEGRDITEHRELEAQLLQAQKMEAIGRLAGGVAHDFNTLLGSITGYSEMLQERAPGNEALLRPAEQIHRCAERGATLTRQLLAFSRRQVLQPKVLNLNDVVTDMDDMLRRLVGEDIEVRQELDPDLQWVRVDGGQFEQVLMNLIVNSADAMPRGGSITIRTRNVPRKEVFGPCGEGEQEISCVEISVADTGVGMDEATRSHIFEPFFTTKEQGKGTGLGLATVYGIVKQSGGSITVESELGAGTVIRMFLPASVPPAARTAPAVQRGEVESGWETVLLVEDDEMFRTLLVEVLEANGYKLLSAAEPSEALALAEQHAGKIHLLVSDMVMPGMNGGDLARTLARRLPSLKVILMSGYTDEALAERGVVETETTFLQKPFSTRDLARTVRAVLDGEG